MIEAAGGAVLLLVILDEREGSVVLVELISLAAP